ncbi:hypothetical protein CP08DC60_0403B, partial [Chlamydia psittaci 08DC60]
EILSLGK